MCRPATADEVTTHHSRLPADASPLTPPAPPPARAQLPLRLRPYRILATSPTSGLIEVVPNAKSLDSLKKSTANYHSLAELFKRAPHATRELHNLSPTTLACPSGVHTASGVRTASGLSPAYASWVPPAIAARTPSSFD